MVRILALFSICFALAGCELVADFDRSKIPQPDSGTLPTGNDDAGLPPIDAASGTGGTAALDDDGGATDDDAGR